MPTNAIPTVADRMSKVPGIEVLVALANANTTNAAGTESIKRAPANNRASESLRRDERLDAGFMPKGYSGDV